jgi:transcriptional regulator NrdR family protein
VFCKCGGKLRVLDNVKNPTENEIYRQKECVECGRRIFTVEYEVIVNQRFKADWANNYRKSEDTKF